MLLLLVGYALYVKGCPGGSSAGRVTSSYAGAARPDEGGLSRRRRYRARGDRAAGRQESSGLTARRAQAVGAAFFVALSHFERTGEAGRVVRGTLRTTASRALARQLLDMPPQLPAGEKPRDPMRVTRWVFVPGDVLGGRVVSGELVGSVSEAGGRGAIPLDMRRAGHRWRVAGLGR